MNKSGDWPFPGDSATDLSEPDVDLGSESADDPSDETADNVLEPTVRINASIPELVEPAARQRRSVRASTSESQLTRYRLLVILLASYASALTLALLYLLASGGLSRSQNLENLPDIAPLEADEFRYVPVEASLPPGHRIRIGESRRFGHVLVEPLRATRGHVEFVHYSGQPSRKAPNAVPALKLWVRFTNLSDGQIIAPLDRTLLFKRSYQEESDRYLTNNFLISDVDASARRPPLLVLDHPLTSEWDLRQQELGVKLKPGEAVETFVPSQSEGIDSLQGQIVWRMHIRKGFHTPTGHGVTTLIEVEFDAEDISPESAASPAHG